MHKNINLGWIWYIGHTDQGMIKPWQDKQRTSIWGVTIQQAANPYAVVRNIPLDEMGSMQSMLGTLIVWSVKVSNHHGNLLSAMFCCLETRWKSRHWQSNRPIQLVLVTHPWAISCRMLQWHVPPWWSLATQFDALLKGFASWCVQRHLTIIHVIVLVLVTASAKTISWPQWWTW